tara:strand:+ start:87 stop:785 length:699 start_codon:yes stop_codon:yes gene_type:complete
MKTIKANLTTHIPDILEPGVPTHTLDTNHRTAEEVWGEFIDIQIKNRLPVLPTVWADYWGNDIGPIGTQLIYKNKIIDRNRAYYNKHRHLFQDWLERSTKNPLWKGYLRKMSWMAGPLKPLDQTIWVLRMSGMRVKNTDYIWTLTKSSIIPVYGPHHRHLTPTELLRCQGFPDSFKYHSKKELYKQLGNSVPPPMVEAAARLLFSHRSDKQNADSGEMERQRATTGGLARKK